MQGAVERLTVVVDQEYPDELSPALAMERAAYQALLHLRAREFQVARTELDVQAVEDQSVLTEKYTKEAIGFIRRNAKMSAVSFANVSSDCRHARNSSTFIPSESANTANPPESRPPRRRKSRSFISQKTFCSPAQIDALAQAQAWR